MGITNLVDLIGSPLDFAALEFLENRRPGTHQGLSVCGTHGQYSPPLSADIVLQPIPGCQLALSDMAVVDRTEYLAHQLVRALILTNANRNPPMIILIMTPPRKSASKIETSYT